MFKKLAEGIQYPPWVRDCPRYRRLDLFDRLLDGTFYDHLGSAFYDETDQQRNPIKIEARRPSAQFRFPTMVAAYTARKLFAGNHAPRVRHQDDGVRRQIRKVLKKAKFLPTMLEAAKLGSVGSVAVTFRIEQDETDTRIAMHVWRAKYCEPSFDSMGELTNLRVQYVTTGTWLQAIGAVACERDKTIERSNKYWFIRDYGMNHEVSYRPIKETEWNPVQGFIGEPTRQMEIWEAIEHGLGFVPGHWFTNLVGGEQPDGCCTFEPGIPNSIELDYTLSQIGRGVRYNAAPTLVLIGNVMNAGPDGSLTRSPVMSIQMQGGTEDKEGGAKVEAGDAKLLEMNGASVEASLKLIDKLHDLALEQVAAARKDPEKMKGPMSGRAMEFIDQEFYDLVMELREQYGDHGALILARKLLQACDPSMDLSSFTLGWPRLFQPTPTDIAQIIPALAIAIDPLKAGPAMPAEPGGTDANGGAKPGKHATTGPDQAYSLMTVAQARAWLEDNMGLSLLQDDDEDPEEPLHSGPTSSPESTPPPPVDTTRPAPNLEGGIPRPTDENLDI